LAAIEGDADGVAGLMFFHDGVDILGIDDPLPVDGHDEVAAQQDGSIAHIGLLRAAAQAGLLGRSAGNNLLNQNS